MLPYPHKTMGRKRKRSKAPAASTPEAESHPPAATATAASTAAAADPTSSTPQQVTLDLDDTAAEVDAKAIDASEQLPEDGEDSSDGMPGIPWALPPEENEDEDQEQEGAEEEEDGERSERSDAADEGESSSLSAATPDPENRWKQHPDRRRKLAAAGGGAGRRGPNSSSNGAGWPGGRAAGKGSSRKAQGRGGRAGGRRRRDEENAGAEAGLDEADEEDVSPVVADGYYGPPPPPCTVFAPRAGKTHRVATGNSSASRAPTALVVGLSPLEQLCFVGAALVRCGRGQADLSGYTLLPAAWGPYVEAHSPRWMGLLVVRALDAEEYSDAVARGGGGRRGSEGDGAVGADDEDDDDYDAAENEIEEAIDRIAEDFPVVVVLRSLSGGRSLKFLSAQADADALYSQAGGAGDLPVAVDHQALHHVPEEGGGDGELGRCDKTTAVNASLEEPTALPLRLAAELRLPGMQVVMAAEAGLVPFTVSQGWADAANALLDTPPPPTGGCGGGGGGGGGGGTVLVCGAKGVGKSTLCRFLVNRMLSQHREVAYMDCDLGQPEFTAPGQVSLHLLQAPVVGPPHANIRRPQLAYFVGTTSSKPEPLLYSAAVRALAERASAGVTAGAGQQQQEEEQLSASFFAGAARPPAPLVVNTDGWVKGMGEDLLGAVIDVVRPRHIVQILGTSTAKKFTIDLGRLPEGCQVHRVEAWSPPVVPVGGAPTPPRPSAQDQRTLRLVAYFLGQAGCGSRGTAAGDASGRTTAVGEGRRRSETGAVASGLLGDSSSGGRGDSCVDQLTGASMRGGKVYDLEHQVAALLAAARPRRVPWKTVQVRIMTGSVSPSLALHAINGALVGLVAMPGQPGNGGGGGLGPLGGGELICLAETPLAPCVGLGIVRSVDVEKRVLYVLTPEPSEVLRDVNVLVVGSLQLPMVMVYDPNWCSHPYFSSEAVGGGVIKNRSNLLRKGGQNG